MSRRLLLGAAVVTAPVALALAAWRGAPRTLLVAPDARGSFQALWAASVAARGAGLVILPSTRY